MSCTLHVRCRSMRFRASYFMHQLLLPSLFPRALQLKNAAEGCAVASPGGVLGCGQLAIKAMDAQIDQTNSGGGGAPSWELT